MPIIVGSTMDPDMGPGIRLWRQEGEVNILRRHIGKRFGDLPTCVDERLTGLSSAELEKLSPRLFDASSFDELFGL